MTILYIFYTIFNTTGMSNFKIRTAMNVRNIGVKGTAAHMVSINNNYKCTMSFVLCMEQYNQKVHNLRFSPIMFRIHKLIGGTRVMHLRDKKLNHYCTWKFCMLIANLEGL